MITNRYLEPADYEALQYSLAMDEHHNDTPLEFFLEQGTVTSVYEDKNGPAMYVRGKPLMLHVGEDTSVMVLRLDIQYVSNDDGLRNARIMKKGFAELETKALANGFRVIVFESNVEALRSYAIRVLGFTPLYDPEWSDWLVKVLH